MSEAWTALRDALQQLADVCVKESQALVELDAQRLAPLQIQKAEAVRNVARCYKELEEPTEGFPPELRQLAEKCQQLNYSNKQMLLLTLKCLDSMLHGVPGRKKYGPGLGESNSRIMDFRV